MNVIRPRPANLTAAFLHQGFGYMVRSRLRGVWVCGEIPAGGAVWAANHHSWWDPFLADAVTRSAGRTAGLVMDDDNLAQFGFMRRLGVVSTREPRAALRMLGRGHVLVVYPEGELRSAGPPGPLARGAAWFAVRADAALTAVAVRVAVRGHEAPEAYVSLRHVPCDGDLELATTRLELTLRSDLAAVDELVARTDPREPLPGYRQVVSGRRSWDERLSRLPTRRPQ